MGNRNAVESALPRQNAEPAEGGCLAVDRVSGARVERKDALGCREGRQRWTQSRDRRSRWKWADRSLRTDGQQRRGSISIGTGAC